LSLPLEHIQHAIRHQKTGHNIDAGQGDSDKAQHAGDIRRQLCATRADDGADNHDAGDGIGAAHQRGMKGGRNLVDQFYPDEQCQNENGKAECKQFHQSVSFWVEVCGVSRVSALWRTLPCWTTSVAATISSSSLGTTRPSSVMLSKKAVMLRVSSWEACTGTREGWLAWPTRVTPSTSTFWFRTVPSTLPPLSAARSTMTEPLFIRWIISWSISLGAGFPGTAAVVITRSARATQSASCCRWAV